MYKVVYLNFEVCKDLKAAKKAAVKATVVASFDSFYEAEQFSASNPGDTITGVSCIWDGKSLWM